MIASASNQPLNAFWASIPQHTLLGKVLARYAKLECVELASHAVIRATGSLALRAAFKDAPIAYLDHCIVACPLDKQILASRALHHSTCRWRQQSSRLPLGDYAETMINVATLGLVNTCRECKGRQDVLNRLGDQIITSVTGKSQH